MTFWKCIECKRKHCKGKLSTQNNTILSEVCLPDDVAIEVRKHLVNPRKWAMETDSAISKIYVEEVGQLFNRGYDFVTSMLLHTRTNNSCIAFRIRVRAYKRLSQLTRYKPTTWSGMNNGANSYCATKIKALKTEYSYLPVRKENTLYQLVCCSSLTEHLKVWASSLGSYSSSCLLYTSLSVAIRE